MGVREIARSWIEKDGAAFRDIQFAAIAISILLTVVLILQDHMPNDDGVLYLLSAELISKGQWGEALQLFNWPFFPFLIGVTHTFTGLDMETSAYALNGVLQAILVGAFVGVAAEMGGGRRVAVIAAFLILSYPAFNEARPEIVRDFGYWAFFMLALLCFLKDQACPRYRLLFAWLGALVVATLFRVEGMVLLGLMPLFYLAFRDIPLRQRVGRTLRVYGIYLLGLVVLILVLLTAGVDLFSVERWNKPLELASMFYKAISTDLADKAQVLKDHYLISYSADYAWMIVMATIVIVLVVEVLSSVGLVYGLFAGYALFVAGGEIRPHARLSVLCLVAVNMLMLSLFVIMLGFLTGRYTLALTLLVMLFAAFGALPFYRRLRGERTGTRRSKWVNAVFALVAVYYLVDGIYSFSPGKVHIEQAAEWLDERMSPDDKVFSLDAPLLYRVPRLDWKTYSELQATRWQVGSLELRKSPSTVTMLSAIDWTRYDYVVALVKRKRLDEQGEIERLLNRPPLKVFENRKGDRAVIFATDAG